MKKEKIKRGDRVRFISRFDQKGIIGTLDGWKFRKDTGIIQLSITPDEGVGFYFLGNKHQFTMEKLDK
jgi:hypothetical protein